ncbi:hypothetical protein AAZX31_09G084000 [Glycine max]
MISHQRWFPTLSLRTMWKINRVREAREGLDGRERRLRKRKTAPVAYFLWLCLE